MCRIDLSTRGLDEPPTIKFMIFKSGASSGSTNHSSHSQLATGPPANPGQTAQIPPGGEMGQTGNPFLQTYSANPKYFIYFMQLKCCFCRSYRMRSPAEI